MAAVEDNGCGMTPDKMRQCMSLGYSAKSKMANTIGQYGNGVFRCRVQQLRKRAYILIFGLIDTCKLKNLLMWSILPNLILICNSSCGE
ncbi:protein MICRORCHIDIA 7-like [Andrographis paniculata]|uniref:protein MICRORCHIDIA 7-like n=1 Tax=Andrographis paniculata TaxID=175694 RepID=UPI0021E7BA99|nr:protein MICRORCHIDIA 7-like [Andrographis paniculata]